MWIELDGWQAKLRFSACHFIPNHPKCGNLHGHTYAMSVKIVGQQIDNFVMDFEDLKRDIGEICEMLDHKTACGLTKVWDKEQAAFGISRVGKANRG